MLNGRCLCGKVSYKYNGVIEEIAMCHCSQCRKAQGGAFATNSPVETDKLEFTGTEFIKEFQTSDIKVRAFCSNCGSPLYSARSDMPEIRRLRMGSIDTDFSCDSRYHIYTDSKASWFEIVDNQPQYKEQT
ncbi:MAG: hypothetical protein ACI90U_001863 [Pseudomonadales bacterium]|jgi:hypothetical protein